MSATKIYVAGLLQKGENILLPLPSAAILFVLGYCSGSAHDFTVGVVPEDLDPSVCVDVDRTTLDNMRIHYAPAAGGAENCALPVMVEEDGHLIRSGLCSIIRQIVSLAHRVSPQEDYKDLLGFRGGSLKACAEVSGWTKLCEVELPESISEVIGQVRNNEQNDVINIPENVMKLEWHFEKPPKIHNDDKLKRKLLANVKEDIKHTEEIGDLNSFKIERDINCSHCCVRYCLQHKEEEQKVRPVQDNNSACVTDCNNYDQIKRGGSSMLSLEQFNSVEELSNYVMKMTIHNIDLCHLYSEGMTITVSDLILFTYVYYLLDVLSFELCGLTKLLPRIMGWIGHMITLPKIKETSLRFGMNINRLQTALSDKDDVNNKITFSIPPDVASLEKEDEMELSRRCRGKYRAIKPDVINALNKVKDGRLEVDVGSHPCGDDVKLKWEAMPDGIHPGKDLPVDRLARKCQQLENLVTAVTTVAKGGDVIVDFCSGGGHLGIAIAFLLPNCQVYLVENNESSLMRAKSRVEKTGLKNVTFFQCNQDYFCGKFDVGVSLHACGSATDMVLHQCLKNGASFVICPCCYGGIQNTHLITYPRSNRYMKANILYKDYLTLGHAADQTEFNIALEEQGKYCMHLIDTDRAALAVEQDYKVTLCSLIPLSCTPKNNLLIGQPLCKS